jgi:serine-type D-Ala-D-Ala carboxypeptidase (penicillin-binding protein 5/6)
MMSPGRITGIAVGALAILGLGVYGPAMLLGPLPTTTVRIEQAATVPAEVPPITLPATGASAMAVVDDDDGARSVETIAAAGDPAAVPIGGAAKLVTLLVTLDSLPLPTDGAGPAIPIGPADYSDYVRYSGEGSRTVQVSPGEQWTERDVVRAVLLASSNNHADTLVRWAFGSVDAYVEAANAWLAEQGFTATRVDDATGLSDDNVGTAEELARLAGLVVADAELSEMLEQSDANPPLGTRSIPDVVARAEDGAVRAITRSFTDGAGLSFVYTADIPAPEGSSDGPRRITGAMLLMPDYETLDPAVAAAVESAAAASTPVTVIEEGAQYGTVRSVWGDEARLVASVTRTDAAWGSAFGEASVTVDEFSTASDGREVGRVAVPTATGDLASPLRLEGAIRDPGPIWRLTNPAPLIEAYAASGDR